MSDAALTALADRLGVPGQRLAPLAGFSDQQVGTLDRAVETAMAAEDRAFDAALKDALSYVPWLLRGPAAKLLFPGGRRG